MNKLNESAEQGAGFYMENGSKGQNNNRSPLLKACLNQQKNLHQQLMSSSSLTRLQKNNPLFGEVLSGVSMVVHEPPQQQQQRENYKHLNTKRSLFKRRDELCKQSAGEIPSESDEIAPWGGGPNGSQKSIGTQSNLNILNTKISVER